MVLSVTTSLFSEGSRSSRSKVFLGGGFSGLFFGFSLSLGFGCSLVDFSRVS